MNILQSIIIAVTSGALGSIFSYLLTKEEAKRTRQWEIKRTACLEALDVIDSMFANKYKDASYQELVSIKKIREVHSKLTLSCEKLETVKAFEKCLGLEGEYSPKDLVILRNLLRKEFGFRKLDRPKDGKYWIFMNNLKDKENESGN